MIGIENRTSEPFNIICGSPIAQLLILPYYQGDFCGAEDGGNETVPPGSMWFPINNNEVVTTDENEPDTTVDEGSPVLMDSVP